jgi:hypothetical protein
LEGELIRDGYSAQQIALVRELIAQQMQLKLMIPGKATGAATNEQLHGPSYEWEVPSDL